MKEIYNNIITINDDYLPSPSFGWKKVYNSAIDFLKDEKIDNLNSVLKKFENYVNVLVLDGDVYEDLVMKTAILYFLSCYSNFDVNFVKGNKPIVDGVNVLIKNEKNLKNVFENEKYRYLGKIKLAFLINELQNKNLSNLVNTMQVLSDGKKIVAQYKSNCNGKLYRLLCSLL